MREKKCILEVHVNAFFDQTKVPITSYKLRGQEWSRDNGAKNVSKKTNQIKIKSSLYSPYYAEACNELRGPSPRLSAWATQLRRNVATVASRWRHCVDLTGPGIEPQTSRTDSVRFATEPTAGYSKKTIACLSFIMQKRLKVLEKRP